MLVDTQHEDVVLEVRTFVGDADLNAFVRAIRGTTEKWKILTTTPIQTRTGNEVTTETETVYVLGRLI